MTHRLTKWGSRFRGTQARHRSAQFTITGNALTAGSVSLNGVYQLSVVATNSRPRYINGTSLCALTWSGTIYRIVLSSQIWGGSDSHTNFITGTYAHSGGTGSGTATVVEG